MKTNGEPSLEELSEGIENIHRAGLDSSHWPAVLRWISEWFHSANVAVWIEGAPGDFMDMHALQQAEEITHDYAQHYGRLDKLRPAVMQAPVGTILTNEMVISRSDFVRTEFYADFAARHDLLSCMQARLCDGPGYSGYVGIGRTNRVGAFETADIRLLRLLLPHLRGALWLRQQLGFAAVERDSALAALDSLSQGMLIVNIQRRVLHANPAAAALLSVGDGLTTTRGLLVAKRSADDAALGRALGNRTGTLAISRPSGRTALAVTVQRIGFESIRASIPQCVAQIPVAVVFVIEPAREGTAAGAVRSLRALYGLTSTETAVAGTIARGLGAREAADALDVAPSTLRWHLQRVFEKTGTRRQAELTRLVERLGYFSSPVEEAEG